MGRQATPHTNETIPPKTNPVTITPTKNDSNPKEVQKETPIDPKKLLEEIQSLKKEVLNQCKSYIETEIKKVNEIQMEQNKKLEVIIKKNVEEQAITMKMIQELTSLVTSLHGKSPSTPVTTQHEVPMKPSGKKVDAMDIDKESNKRKDMQTQRPSHHKKRATSQVSLTYQE